MSVIDELVPLLKKLRLSGVLQSLALRLREASEDNLGYEEFLYRLVKDEVTSRCQAARPTGAPSQLRAPKDARGFRLPLQPTGAKGEGAGPGDLRLCRAA